MAAFFLLLVHTVSLKVFKGVIIFNCACNAATILNREIILL